MKFFLNFIKIYQLVQKLLERETDRQHDDFINHSFIFNDSKLKARNVYESIVEKLIQEQEICYNLSCIFFGIFSN
jgi:hypothetical protein